MCAGLDWASVVIYLIANTASPKVYQNIITLDFFSHGIILLLLYHELRDIKFAKPKRKKTKKNEGMEMSMSVVSYNSLQRLKLQESLPLLLHIRKAVQSSSSK
jgi:hypothetical protein